MGLAELGVGLESERCLACYLLLNAAGLVDVLVFHVKNRVDGMLSGEGPETAFQAPTGEDSAVTGSGLAFQVQLRSPPAIDPILDFSEGREVSALPAAGDAGGAVHFQFEVAGLFQMVVVSHEVGCIFLGKGGNNQQQREQEQESPDMGHSSFVGELSCNTVASSFYFESKEQSRQGQDRRHILCCRRNATICNARFRRGGGRRNYCGTGRSNRRFPRASPRYETGNRAESGP